VRRGGWTSPSHRKGSSRGERQPPAAITCAGYCRAAASSADQCAWKWASRAVATEENRSSHEPEEEESARRSSGSSGERRVASQEAKKSRVGRLEPGGGGGCRGLPAAVGPRRQVMEGGEWWACERSEPWKKFFALDFVCAVRTRWNLHRVVHKKENEVGFSAFAVWHVYKASCTKIVNQQRI
jgi:hypothetical protein